MSDAIPLRKYMVLGGNKKTMTSTYCFCTYKGVVINKLTMSTDIN